VSRNRFTRGDEVFRELLKRARLKADLTQAEVAHRLKTPQSYVSKYETGERRLDFVETAMVCDALGISIESFARQFTAKCDVPLRNIPASK
jgi:transcriptional regulator with XRE-family HTH domain